MDLFFTSKKTYVFKSILIYLVTRLLKIFTTSKVKEPTHLNLYISVSQQQNSVVALEIACREEGNRETMLSIRPHFLFVGLRYTRKNFKVRRSETNKYKLNLSPNCHGFIYVTDRLLRMRVNFNPRH